MIILSIDFSHIFTLTDWDKAPPIPFSQKNLLYNKQQIIYIPAKDNRCWNLSIPCTPYYIDQIHIDTKFGHKIFSIGTVSESK